MSDPSFYKRGQLSHSSLGLNIPMQGLVVRHYRLGLGKVVSIDRQSLTIHFADGGVRRFALSSQLDGIIKRALLPVGIRCKASGGMCSVKSIFAADVESNEPYSYEMVGEQGATFVLSELELTLIADNRSHSPLQALASLQPQPFGIFLKRERLLDSYQKTVFQGFSIRAMLSSRVDLMAHQAYVAGTVLRDPVRRYILADEVGLGKTIEAGIVIHDLLASDPAAKILVLCPSALTQQWLCELYSKFGGYVFRLLDLHTPEAIYSQRIDQAIVSHTRAAFDIPSWLLAVDWELVVVDEAHHLLISEVLYDFVKEISKKTPSVLLLSAIPAQRREDEFRKLLGLLEPERYGDGVETSHFKELFDIQTDLGRRLRMFTKRLSGLQEGIFLAGEVVAFAKRLAEMPIVRTDPVVERTLTRLSTSDAPVVLQLGRKLAYHIAEQYRINRRILRNRRQYLVTVKQIAPIERRCELVAYKPDQAELETLQAIQDLLEPLHKSKLSLTVRSSAVRLFYHSATWPTAICSLLEHLADCGAREPGPSELDFLRLGFSSDYSDAPLYNSLLCGALKPYIKSAALRHAARTAKNWLEYGTSQRYKKLVALLRAKVQQSEAKLIVFAGLQNLAADLVEGLRQDLGQGVVADFRHDMPVDEKELSVRQFHSSPAIKLLVSDESGGEGRNFQFASEILHFDVPWYASRIEQRIGRLDRIGREHFRLDVLSTVLFGESTTEEALVRCFADGLHVFTRSISGLEFGLRSAEDDIALKAMERGRDGLIQYVPQLHELAIEERARDESEEVLDTASFESAAADKFRLMSRAPLPERYLERDFTEYFRTVSPTRSVKDFPLEDFETRRWEFDADNLTLPTVEAELGQGSRPIFKGTFYRKVAQARPDLQFFNIGNPLFDAVISSLKRDLSGRLYAIEVHQPGVNPWIGFELIFCVRFSDRDSTVPEMSFKIATRPLHLFYTLDGEPYSNSDGLLLLRTSLKAEDKNKSWINLTGDKTSVLTNVIDAGTLGTLLHSIYESASHLASERLGGSMAIELEAEKKRLRQLIGNLPSLDPDQYQRQYSTALLALEEWHPELDSIGFLAINPSWSSS